MSAPPKRRSSFSPMPLTVRMRCSAFGISAGILTGTIFAVTVINSPAGAWHDVARFLSAAYHYVTGHPLTETLGDTISRAVWEVSFYFSVAIAICATLLWILLGHVRRNAWIDALWLGAVLGGVAGAVNFADERLAFAAGFSLVGAAAGLVTWLVTQLNLRNSAAALGVETAP